MTDRDRLAADLDGFGLWRVLEANIISDLAEHLIALGWTRDGDVRGRLDLLTHVCQDILRDAGTAKWPVNLDRLRMALDELDVPEFPDLDEERLARAFWAQEPHDCDTTFRNCAAAIAKAYREDADATD